NSLALLTVNAPEESTFFEVTLNPSTLLTGTNVIAVEVHQAAINSPDLGFDLALLGLIGTNFTQGVYLTSPAEGGHYDTPATVMLSAFAAADAGISKVEYFDGVSKL